MTTPATPTTWLPESKEALVDYERCYSQKDRATMDASDFAGPHRSFPILTQQDVYNAARLIGHADDPEAVKRKIIAIAKRKGFKLPDSWQKDGEDGKAKESTTVVVGGNADGFTPKPRVARLKVCWIENDAISLNGRQYPRETVEKLIRNAQTDLANPEALPITCFISHGKADEDNSRDLVGRVTEIWQEGSKGYASIDIPDTAAGRDIAALAAYEYLTTVSLRASGADLRTDRTRGVPQVDERAGERLTLNGIDITTNPGLSKTARINQVILESADRPGLAEAFDLSEIPILEVAMATKSQQKADAATTPVPGATTPADGAQSSVITEEALSPLTSGVSQGTDGSQTADGYQQKMMPLPPRANMDPATSAAGSPEHVSAMQEAHDRIAMVQGRSCAPSAESAYGQRLLSEAGRTLNGKNDGHLDVAHDHLARALGKQCEGAGSKHSAAPLVPDNDNDMESAPRTSTLKETKSMTPQEAARLLEAAGYKVEAPKTKAQILEEELTALKEEMRALKEARQPAQVPAQPAPQRRSLVEGANVGLGSAAPVWQTPVTQPQQEPGRPGVVKYRNGDYLREKFSEIDWARLADRSYPIPPEINVEWLVNELAQTASAMIEEKYQAF